MLLNAHGGLRGGSQRSVRAIARTLSDRGHRVEVACPSGPWAETLGVETVILPRTTWLGGKLEQAGPGNLRRLVALLAERRSAGAPVDVLHTFQYGSYLLARAAAALERRAAGPIRGAAHVHTVLGPLSPGHVFEPTDHLVAVSRAFGRDALVAGARPDRVTVIPHRLVLDTFPKRPGGADLVYASRLEGHLARAADQVLRAATRSGHACVVAGDGPELPRLRAAWPDHTFLGHVRDMSALHGRAALVIGVGRTLYEAMASGRACLCAGPDGFADVVEPATIEAMATHNMSSRHRPGGGYEPLAAAITALMTDAERRDALGEWGARWVRQHLDVRAGMERLEGVYAAALDTDGYGVGDVLGQLARLTTEKTRRTLSRVVRGIKRT